MLSCFVSGLLRNQTAFYCSRALARKHPFMKMISQVDRSHWLATREQQHCVGHPLIFLTTLVFTHSPECPLHRHSSPCPVSYLGLPSLTIEVTEPQRGYVRSYSHVANKAGSCNLIEQSGTWVFFSCYFSNRDGTVENKLIHPVISSVGTGLPSFSCLSVHW